VATRWGWDPTAEGKRVWFERPAALAVMTVSRLPDSFAYVSGPSTRRRPRSRASAGRRCRSRRRAAGAGRRAHPVSAVQPRAGACGSRDRPASRGRVRPRHQTPPCTVRAQTRRNVWVRRMTTTGSPQVKTHLLVGLGRVEPPTFRFSEGRCGCRRVSRSSAASPLVRRGFYVLGGDTK
jgi:hypothetical protein